MELVSMSHVRVSEHEHKWEPLSGRKDASKPWQVGIGCLECRIFVPWTRQTGGNRSPKTSRDK